MDRDTSFQLASLDKLCPNDLESFPNLPHPGQESDLPISKKSCVNSANAVLGQSSRQSICNSESWNKGHWDSNSWNWDSVSFLAKPNNIYLTTNEHVRVHDSENAVRIHEIRDHSEVSLGILALGTHEPERMGNLSLELKRKHFSNEGKQVLDKEKPYLCDSSSGENMENLTLNLGGMSYSDAEGNTHRSNKRHQPGSPGKYHPMCQVDNCQANLTNAKDYHRRHRVCDMHFKSTKALVNRIMQRFCQQCSRFHPISEFDNEKRSCRRRLAGHNKRRRRTRFEDIASKHLMQERNDQALTKVDIAGLIGILSKIQEERLVGQSNMDCSHILQCLKNVSAISPKVETGDHNLNNTHNELEKDAEMHSFQANEYQSSQLTASLLSILSAFAGCSSDALALLTRIVSRGIPSPVMYTSAEQSTIQNIQSINPNYCCKPGISTGKNHLAVPNKTVESYPSASCLFPNTSLLSGQHSGSLGGNNHYLTGKSRDVVDERYKSLGLSSLLQLSPPDAQKLFPLCSDVGNMMNKTMPTPSALTQQPSNYIMTQQCQPACCNEKASEYTFIESVSKHSMPSYLSGSSNAGKPLDQASSDCLSGLNEALYLNFQERTGRIVFKLFGKDPGDFPLTLRTQIFEWLSQSPSDMESYIRPGCVILSIFVSMSSCAWEQLHNSFQKRLEHLVASDNSHFWRTDRITVQVKQRLAFLRDGKIQLTKMLRPLKAPELSSVWPVAIVAGEDTTLVLRGRNLNMPGTKFLCAYRGKYTFEEVLEGVEQTGVSASMPHEHTKRLFKISGGPANVLGRCFIEVEHTLKGNIFPIIVADTAICMELRSLELELDDFSLSLGTSDMDPLDYHILDNPQLRFKMETLCFLNDLGWLFQRSNFNYCRNSPTKKFSVSRFRGLFVYAVEQDWCALIKRLLDLFFIMNVGQEGLPHEAIKHLSEANLLHRAVKRKCRQMVDFLLHYLPPLVNAFEFNNYFTFSPDMAGPCGLTPLHIAASMQDAEGMVDALTSDPHEVGLSAWSSSLDTSQKTPESYARLKNNLSYLHMIQRKLSNKRNAQEVITIWDANTYRNQLTTQGRASAVASGIRSTQFPLWVLPKSCARCSEMTGKQVGRIAGIHGRLYRPFLYSILSIAVVCVCACLIFKCPPQVASVSPFKWENVEFGMF